MGCRDDGRNPLSISIPHTQAASLRLCTDSKFSCSLQIPVPMHLLDLSPIVPTSFCTLQARSTVNAAGEAKDLQREIFAKKLPGKNHLLGDGLDVFHARCSALTKAQILPEQHLPYQDVAAWNALFSTYIEEGCSQQALDGFKCMQHEGITPNALTFACILKACGILGAIMEGAQIHDEIARHGLLQRLGNALVDMYAKCGALGKAQQVLEELCFRTVVSWTALIAGCAQHGDAENALSCFESMQSEGLVPNEFTFSCVLKACGTIGAQDEGKRVHCGVLKQGLLGNNVVLGTAFVDMYAKCGDLTKAQQVLEELPSRNVVSWTALIRGFTEHGQGEEALYSFERMQCEGILPNAVTFACILKTCGSIGAVQKGKQIHHEMVTKGFLGNIIMLGNALVDMYARCCSFEEAQHVLEGLSSRDVISWNCLIAGYMQQGKAEQALACFKQMQCEGFSPNASTFACILKAYGTVGDVDKGKQIHDQVVQQGFLEDSVVLGAALVDMYVKCGDLSKAEQALEALPVRDVVSWTTLITGYSEQGRGEDTLNSFKRMQFEGILPNAATFSCVLSMCSHLGLVELGFKYYTDMKASFGIMPKLEHYTCMVDLFGRAGQLEKAVNMLEEMPHVDYSAAWHALLGACRKYGDVNVGRWAFDQAAKISKVDGVAYTLMANIYTAAGMEESAKLIENLRIESKAW